ncbi:MAG: chromosomal replication initiator protein DnaA [Rhodobacteraceae bacterium]|nr:chromosomal replication initiator protein DnaA [Paracoccaceae bacterium]MYF45764.1 chromosomal replication initiator protein DnaA [Paracoccaceae bacterium]MYI90841.1 chromosomal replication initiator protein DnaA [Paracoccaceae bacterium]
MQKDWEQVRTKLKYSLGLNVFNNWIEDINLISIDGGRVIISVPSRFTGEYITENFGKEIIESFKNVGRIVTSVKYQVRPSDSSSRKSMVTNTKTAQGSTAKSGMKPDKRYTFERFVVGDANGKAHIASWQIANEHEENSNSLYLHGNVGLGKTHLLHAIFWMKLSKNTKLKHSLLTGQQFSDYFVAATKHGKLLEFRERIRSVDAIFIDDIQLIHGKKGTTQELDLTLDTFLSEGKLVVATGLNTIDEMDEFGPRIKSRLQHGFLEKLEPPDYDLRLRILKQKLKDRRSNNFDLRFAEGVLEFVADNISGDIRKMEGALQRLIVTAGYLNCKTITLDLAEEAITDLVKFTKPPTVEEIMKAVANYHGLNLSDLTGPKRISNVVRARQIGIYLSNELTSKSLPDIGSCFDRDRTTIIHSINKIESLKSRDKELEYSLVKLRRELLQG